MKFTSAIASIGLLVFAAAFTVPLAQAAPPAKAFGELPVGFDGAISPDGNNIAVILNVRGNYSVIAKETKGDISSAWRVSLGDEIKPRYIKWVNDHRFVVSIAKSEKYKNTPYTVRYLYSGDIRNRKGDFVIKPKRIFRQFNDRVVDWLEDDPDHILMAFSDEEGNHFPDIKKVNVETGRSSTVKRGQGGIEYWITDNDGTPRVGTGKYSSGKSRRIIYNSDSDKWKSVDDYPDLDADTRIFGILKKGTELVIGDYRGKDTLGLYIYDLGQKRITRSLFHNEEYDASGVILSKDGVSVIGAKYTADKDKTELLGEYGTLLDRLRAKLEDYDVDFVDQTADGNTVFVNMSSPYDPGGLYIFRSEDSKLQRLTPMYNGFTTSDTGDVVAVKYTARDGEKFQAS